MGVVVTVLGFLSVFRRFKRPLGVTISALIFGFVGLLAILDGAWLSAPLFLLAISCPVFSWGLFKGKMWARRAVMLVTGLGLLTSIVVSTTGFSILILESFPLVPFVLGSVYLLWYLDRPHVTEFFGVEEATRKRMHHTEREKYPRALIAVIVGFLALALFLVFCYFNPLNDHAILQDVTNIGEGAGGLGSSARGTRIEFSVTRDDLLNYTFKCIKAQPASLVHFWVTREINETGRVTIVEKIGLEGSGSTIVSQTGKYALWIAAQRSAQVTVECDIFIMSLSLRKPILQSLFLSVYAVAGGIFLILVPIEIPSERLNKRAFVTAEP